MSRRAIVSLTLLGLLAGGCGCHYPRWLPHPFGAPESAPAVPVPVAVTPPEPARPPDTVTPLARPPAPAPKPTPPVEAPKRAEPKLPAPAVVSVEPAPDDRAKKIASARGDLQTGMTALSLRAVNVCATPGAAACLENQGLMKRARDLDGQLAAALADPQLVVNWGEVTTVLRAVVDSAMKGAPK